VVDIAVARNRDRLKSPMRMLRKAGIGMAVAAVLVRFSIFISPADLSDLLNPFMAIVIAWVLSPIVLLGCLVSRSAYWLVGLLPIAVIGNMLAYGIMTDTSSSTAALGWLFLPFYEWAFIVCVSVVLAAVTFVRKVA
jgi:hypothetical protein